MYYFKVGVYYMSEYDAARPKLRPSQEPDSMPPKAQPDRIMPPAKPIEFPKSDKSSETHRDYTFIHDDPNNDILREMQEQEKLNKYTDDL